MDELAIGDVADLTGLAVGTLRMWEQRYGFPEPTRTGSGYRRYSSEDVDVLRRAVALREEGMSVPAALERARQVARPTASPSLYGSIVGNGMPLRPRRLRKRTLVEISRAMENEALAHGAAPVCFGAFQQERFYRRVQRRWNRLAEVADGAVVFADFPGEARVAGRPAELPILPASPLGQEWSVVIDAPGYSALLVAWEQPERVPAGRDADLDRRFEAFWTLDPVQVRAAARVGAALAGGVDPDLGRELTGLLADRPLALERPPVALTALTNRLVEYLDAGAG